MLLIRSHDMIITLRVPEVCSVLKSDTLNLPPCKPAGAGVGPGPRGKTEKNRRLLP